MGWKKQRFLGSGSYGKVHLAVQSSGKMEMAVKSAGIEDSSYLKREGVFLDAVRGCPFVVRCFGEDVSVENGEHVYNLLLEYAPCGTLHDMIEASGGMPELMAAGYTYQLLNGIYCMHTLGIFHCDLKPGNVLVFPGKYNGGHRLKLCDLGLAMFSGEENVYGDSHRGTLPYAPPESLTWRSYTAAKDIWALGCIFVEMVTGKPMWQGGNKHELAMKIAFTNPEIPEHLSPPAKDFLKMCLARDPRQRWTAEMLLDHPFLQRFTVLESKEDEGCVNPLGHRRLWSSSRDLFTVCWRFI